MRHQQSGHQFLSPTGDLVDAPPSPALEPQAVAGFSLEMAESPDTLRAPDEQQQQQQRQGATDRLSAAPDDDEQRRDDRRTTELQSASRKRHLRRRAHRVNISEISQDTNMTTLDHQPFRPTSVSPEVADTRLGSDTPQSDVDVSCEQLEETTTRLRDRVHLQRTSNQSARAQSKWNEAKITESQLDSLRELIKIIRSGNFNQFNELLEERSENFDKLLNVFVDGQTALHYSLIYGRSLAWCKQLILNGANPNLANLSGWHPIHLAAFSGSRDTMRYLIEHVDS